MLLISTYIMYSEVDGFGLFATNSIPKDTIMWKFNPLIDKVMTKGELETLPQHVQAYFAKYAAHKDNKCYLWLDNNRFTNHSDKPNTKHKDNKLIAIRDIEADEEITQTYSNFTRD